MMKRLFFALFCLCFVLGASAQEKTLQVLCIGNSFTFFHDSNVRLEEIAASQGHSLKAKACVVGGYTFYRHLNRDETLSTLHSGKYDVVFLQDQSQTPAVYAAHPKESRLIAQDAVELAERIRCYSHDADIYIEHTWSYPAGNCGGFGSLKNFDQLLRDGSKKMAKKAHTKVSPIGEAFAIARAERPDIELLDPDKKHQSALGTYLKSCVNYLLIYGEAFHGDVANCGYDAASCAYLRSVAERVVLKGEKGI